MFGKSIHGIGTRTKMIGKNCNCISNFHFCVFGGSYDGAMLFECGSNQTAHHTTHTHTHIYAGVHTDTHTHTHTHTHTLADRRGGKNKRTDKQSCQISVH